MRPGKRARVPVAEHPTASEALDATREPTSAPVRWAELQGDWWEIMELEEDDA